jgi:hypothetical protein
MPLVRERHMLKQKTLRKRPDSPVNVVPVFAENSEGGRDDDLLIVRCQPAPVCNLGDDVGDSRHQVCT